MSNYKFKNLIFFFLTFIVLMFVYLNYSSFTSSFDNRLREFFFNYRGEIPTTNSVVIIDIDEKSIKELGQWPFSRDYMAQALVNLTNAQVGIIGMDMIFSEKDRSSPSNMAKIIGLKGDFQNNDLLLAQVIANTPTILGYFFTEDDIYINKKAPNIPAIYTSSMKNNSSNLISSKAVVTNIPTIQDSAYSSGFFNAYSSEDGKITKMPLVLSYKDKIYPSLTLEMIRVASKSQKVKIIEDEFGVKAIKLDHLYIPTDSNGFLSINFRGAKNSFKYISFVDILDGNFKAQDIKGKFVLIGTSATTLADLRAMVYDLAIPGVEIHANIIDNILKGDFLYNHTSSIAIDTITIGLLTFILGSIYLFLNAFLVIPLFLIVITALYSFYYYLLFTQGIIVNLFYPLVSIVITTILAILINYNKEQKQKAIIKDKFSKKVSPAVVQELLNKKSDEFKALKKEVTIFFSDIRDFTNISEKIDDPEKLINLLNLYMEPMSIEIIKTKGTIDKFIGDAIMAYWNAPQDLSNHAKCAVDTALNQITQLEKLNLTLKKEYNLTLDIGIGIHTGEVIIGEMGSSGRSDYTIIGDNVNLASRIEGLTKKLGAKIIISENVKEQLAQEYTLRKLALISVKGKSNAIMLYEVLCKKEESTKDFDILNEKYEEAISLYENKLFKEAIHAFELVDMNQHHKINEFYINEATKYLKNPNLEFSLKFTILDK